MASQEPISVAQLSVARSSAWHQSGDPLLTLEAAQEWLSRFGLVMFTPRAQQLGAPAPSLVEATLGAANEAPSPAQTETARTLAARLVGEGHAVPLNLLGGPGDVPDFLASAQVFSFLYTLRGDKLWKQPPTTSGTNSVTPLALSVYEMLAARGALSAAELASELGRELTESAVARALQELWQHMRVIPLLQQGKGATQWELTTRRFTKAIKAGTNAGQPTALSALVSLYLAQALMASEEETAAFLSPVSPRSRIREVLHALVAARELNELVIEGKTTLHIPGALPEFPQIEAPVAEASAENAVSAEASQTDTEEASGSIKRFTPRGDGERSAFRGKPAAGTFRKTFGAGTGARSSARPPRREGAPTDRERRPFRRDDSAPARPERSQFAKPWEEDRKPRRDATEGGASRPPRTQDRGGERPYRAKPFGDRSDRPARKPYGDRPARTNRPAQTDGPARSDRTARPSGRPFGDRPDRKPFGARPDRNPFGDRSERPARPARRPEDGEGRAPRSFSSSSDRPARAPRREGAEGSRPFRPKTDSGERPYRARPAGEGGVRPVRRESTGSGASERPPFRRREEGGYSRPPRAEGRPSFGARGPRPGPSFSDRGDRGDHKPYPRRSGEAGAERPRRSFSGEGEGSARPRRDFGGYSAPRSPRTSDTPSGERKGPPRAGRPFARPGGTTGPGGGPGRPGSAGFSKFAGRPTGKSAGKRPFSKGPAKGAGRGSDDRRSGPPRGERAPRRPKTDE